jgi:protein required for attachment to host cells
MTSTTIAARTSCTRTQDLRSVIDELSHLVADPACSRLVVCGSPRMLSLLRHYATGLRRRGVVVDELPRDLVNLTVPELRERLAAHGVVPAAAPPRLAVR